MSRFPLLGALIGAATLFSAQAAQAQDYPAPDAPITYTKFPDKGAKPVFTKAPAPVGTPAYNKWLGEMFNGVLFNESAPEKQRWIAEQIVDPDYLQHNKLVQTGRAGLLAFMPYVFQAMPDAHFTVHDVFATKDRVVTRWTWTGTLTGEGFLGVKPKGQHIEFDGIDIWTVRNGKLYEHWDQFDWPRVFIELGVRDLPAPFYGVASQPYGR